MINFLIAIVMVIGFYGCGSAEHSASTDQSSVQGGSMARFSVVGDYMYTVDAGVMNIFDLSNPAKPERANKIHLGFDVESLFAYGETLFIGGALGVYMYDITNPLQPMKSTTFTHVQSCDPVVVSDNFAFVTLNAGSTCQNGTLNQLNIIDVANYPILIKSVDMWDPKGLGVDGNKLFVCDGDAGLKIFEFESNDFNDTQSVDINLVDTLGDIDCYDVIASQQRLIVSNQDEIRQFDYTSIPLQELTAIN